MSLEALERMGLIRREKGTVWVDKEMVHRWAKVLDIPANTMWAELYHLHYVDEKTAKFWAKKIVEWLEHKTKRSIDDILKYRYRVVLFQKKDRATALSTLEITQKETKPEEQLEDIEIELERPHRSSTKSVLEYLRLIGECALRGKIDVQELYDAIKNEDLQRFIQVSREHIYLKSWTSSRKRLLNYIKVLKRLLNSQEFRQYLQDF